MRLKPSNAGPSLDENLCAEIELLLDGTSSHCYASLSGAYRSAMADFARTGDVGMREIAAEAERALRKLLVSLREKACAGRVDRPA